MPRLARVKSPDAIFHIMCKSITEVKLFRSSGDKMKYIELLKNKQETYKFRILGYCFMGNHVHLIFDANGVDVSQIMQGINGSYAKFYNKKYEREGHLFKDRFKSKIVDSDRYLATLSAYIHNNPTESKRYKNCPEKFLFSSLATFLGLREDPFKLVEIEYILRMFDDNLENAKKVYSDYIKKCENKERSHYEFENEKSLYIDQRTIVLRNIEPEKVLEHVCKAMNIPKEMLSTKHNRKVTEAKALTVMLLKSLCNFTSQKVSGVLENVTQSNIASLIRTGLRLFKTSKIFSDHFNELAIISY